MVAVIIILLVFQVYFFIYTLEKIVELKLFDSLVKITHDEIFPKVVSLSKMSNRIKANIVKYLNDYLENNYGKPANYGIIKDIVNREFDLRDEEISQAIPTPLYLGLAGTMIGIIIGLWNMPDFQQQDFYQGINILIEHVKYAMILSFAGLIITTGLSVMYKSVKAKADEERNKLLSYLQAHLLPKLLEADETGQLQLHEKLETFINQLDGIVESINKKSHEIYDRIEMEAEVLEKVNEIAKIQQQTIHELQGIRWDKVAEANVRLYEGVSESLEKLKIFSQYLDALTFVAANMREFVSRTQEIEVLHQKLNETIENAYQIMIFLSKHHKEIVEMDEKVRQTINMAELKFADAVNNLSVKMEEQFRGVKVYANEMEAYTKETLKNLNMEFYRVTSEYVNQIRQTLANSLETEKLKKLDNLDKLEDLLEKMDNLVALKDLLEKIYKIAESNPRQNGSEITKTLQDLNQTLLLINSERRNNKKRVANKKKESNETLPLNKVLLGLFNLVDEKSESKQKQASEKNEQRHSAQPKLEPTGKYHFQPERKKHQTAEEVNELVAETQTEPEQTEKHHSQPETKEHHLTESENVNALEQTVPSKPKIKTYYFAIPDEDGTFKMQYSRETRDDDCYYKIEQIENEKTGKLHYIGKEDDRIALEKYQYYLLRACVNVSPTPFGKATRIKQIKPGEVELVDGNWKITKKIVIELS
jgi:hypothetical protein